jgi:hypothetical protein
LIKVVSVRLVLNTQSKISNWHRQKWNHDIREVVFKPYHHSCGDGCCDEYGTNVYVNGFDLNCDGEDAEQVISALIEFLNIENVSVERVYEDES